MWSHNHDGHLCCHKKQESSQNLGSYNCETYGEKVDKTRIFKIIDQSALMASEILAEMFCKHAVRGVIITESERVSEH